MGILTRFTLESLAKNRMRTVVTVLGVMLSAALLTAVLTTVASVVGMMRDMTVEQEGSWQVGGKSVPLDAIEGAKEDDRVGALASNRELGTAALTLGEGMGAPFYVHLQTLPAAEKGAPDATGDLVPQLHVELGRLPETEGEIVVPLGYRGVELAAQAPGAPASSGAFELNSTVKLALGTRVERATGQELGSHDSSWTDDGDLLDTDIENAEVRPYTVVGFYEESMFDAPGTAGLIAYTAANSTETGTGLGNAWLCAPSVRSYEGMSQLAQDLFGEKRGDLHTMMLYLTGYTNDRGLFDALYGFAAVLAVVIAMASVSLIYNSFQISVSERTRQFGLLSSLGASKRQLRRSVLAESLMVAAVGIPAGLLLGLAGCAVVFRFAGAGIAGLFGAGDAVGSSFPVTVEPAALGIAAVATLACILVSAWVPAVRASRVSAVDAIRQTQDVRLSRRAARRLSRHGSNAATRFLTERDVAPKGLAARLFGMPGFIAHRTLSRNASKGRIAIASLAVSIVLIVVAGSFSDFLSMLTGAANPTLDGVDLMVEVGGSQAGDDGTAVPTPEERERMLADFAQMDGVADARYYYEIPADALLGTGSLTPSTGGADGMSTSGAADGSFAGTASLMFVDSESWQEVCASAGIDSKGLPADKPVAIALNPEVQTSVDGRYASYRPFSDEGARELKLVQLEEKPGYYGTLVPDEDGNGVVSYIPEKDGDELSVPLDETNATSRNVRVAGVANELPSAAALASSEVAFALPASSLALFPEYDAGYRPTYVLSTGGDASVAREVEQELDTYMEERSDLGLSVQNIAESDEQNRMLAFSMQVFTYCFAAITGLIAVANVFNTLANSIMLRRREFAVLKSVGMGERAFRQMIGYECASYIVRGFAIGMALAILAAYAMREALGSAMAGVSFTLPWVNIAVAFALVLAVIAASVAFALHACRTGSIVEALRSEVM